MPVPAKFTDEVVAPIETGDAPAKFGSDVKIDAPPPPTTNGAMMSAKPHATWLDDLESDLRQGGERTFVGRTLGKMQGRDKGYTGLESGTSKGTAEFMGSPVLGATHAAQGIQETPEHPVKGPLKAIGGVLEMATIPGSFVGGPAAEAGISAAPSRKFAAQLFKDVSAHAGDVPVNLTRSGDALLEMGKGGGWLPTPIKKLIERYTAPIKGATKSSREGARPLTYDEARKFYENITSLSAKDKMSLSPSQSRQLDTIRDTLKHDIGDAAAQAGQAAKYYAAMKNYAQASKLLRASSVIAKWAAGLSTAGGGIYEIQNLYRKAAK